MSAAANRTAHVTRQLRSEILRGEYKAGDRLPGERDLASRLAVGRAVVREALRSLEQMGLVEVRRGGGATVCALAEASVEVVPHLLFARGELDRDLALQLLDVHEMLLSGAARLAVERGSEDDLLAAQERVRRLRRGGLGPDERAALLDDLLERITRASGNLVLQLSRRALGPRWLRRVGRLLWDAREPGAIAVAPLFVEIERAIAERDPSATEEAVRSLLRARREHVLSALQRPEIARRLCAPPSDEAP